MTIKSSCYNKRLHGHMRNSEKSPSEPVDGQSREYKKHSDREYIFNRFTVGSKRNRAQ